MKKRSILGSLTLLCLLAMAQAAPVTITTTQGQEADTPVRGDFSARRFGAMDILRVRNATNLTGDATPLGTFTITGKGEAGKTVIFSPELLHFLQADTDGKITLIITRNEAGDTTADNVVHIFASKENATLAGAALSVTLV